MAHPTARVEQGTLTLARANSTETIPVDSPAWYGWLETAATFLFVGAHGSYTARRERASSGRGVGYWRAYYHHAGVRRRVYLGRAAELTLERLETVAAALAGAGSPVSEHTPSDAAPGGSGNLNTRYSPDHAAAPQLLATKLFVPRSRPDVVARPRLLARLDAGFPGKITLVCAPAGFGKTTLLVEWLRRTGRPAAWLALDRGDNDPVVFLRYLIAALQTLAPHVGVALPGLLQLPPQPLETLLTSLLNDLTRMPEGSILVLDDYHVIEAPAIHQAMAFLTEHLPATLHLVIATRAEPPLPLARLRARGHIAEVRADHLRFAPAETRTFLAEAMGLSLSVADAAALESRTEGWIAGLQLAALALRDTDDQPGFIAAFTGSNRFVVDYLADEVLGKQPAHIQAFLLQTSILERMCGELCDAVLGVSHDQHQLFGTTAGAQAESQRLLEQLERANLFVIPLDAERRWYRYHHLFADVLRERLRRGAGHAAVAALHRQACAWYAQAGLVPEAIQHALAAGAPDVAGRLIEAHGQQLIATGEIVSLTRWLRLLPELTLREQPRLLVLLCWLLPNTGALDEVARYRAQAEALLADTTDPVLRGEFLAIQLQPLVFQDRNDEVIAIGRQVLANLPVEHFFHSVSGVVTGLALLRQSRLAEAEHILSQAVVAARARQSLYFIVSGLSRLAILATERGQLARAEQLLSEALDACRDPSGTLSPIAGMALVVLGCVRRWQARWSEAVDTLRDGLRLCGQLNAAPFFFLDGYTCLAEVYARQGEIDAAFEQLALAEERVRRFGNPVFSDTIDAQRASIWRAERDPRYADWLSEQQRRPQTALVAAREKEYVTLVRGLLDAGQQTEAMGWIDRLELFATNTDRRRSGVDVLVLRALALHRMGEARAVHTALADALVLAAPMGYVSVFLEDGPLIAALLSQSAAHQVQDRGTRAHITRVLDAVPEAWGSAMTTGDGPPRAASASTMAALEQALVEPLTARELEILRLIAEGASNGDIAQRLIISIGTVKKHTSNILGKLQVQSRTQAIARARALNLL